MAIREYPQYEQRQTQRVSVHLLEQRFASIRGRDCQLRTRIIDYSPFGIGVVLEGPASRAVIALGEVVSVTLYRNGQQVDFQATLVTKGKMTIMNETYTRLGFKIATTSLRQHIGNARRNRRFELNEVVELSGYCEDPMNDGQKAFFSVEDLSSSGLLLSTSSRNKFILPSMRLEMTLVIPGEGVFPEDLIVRHIRTSENGERYLLGCEFARANKRTLEALADFCLSFARSSSYQNLVEEGFPVAFNPSSLTVQSTESAEDFAQIVHLRLKFAHWHGQMLKVRDPEETMDAHDEYARHVCVKVGSRIVASGRLVFNNGDRSRSTFPASLDLPSHLWQYGFVSVSKIAVDPDFRASMAFIRLWNEIFRIAFLSGVKSMAMIISPNWPALLQNFGLQRLDMQTEELGRFEFGMIDLEGVMKGKGTPFISWALFAAPLLEKLEFERETPRTVLLRARLRLAAWARALLTGFMGWRARFLNQNPASPRPDAQTEKDRKSSNGRDVA